MKLSLTRPSNWLSGWNETKLTPRRSLRRNEGEYSSSFMKSMAQEKKHIDCVYSSLRLGLPSEDCGRVLDCLARMGFELGHPLLQDRRSLFAGLEEFRQHLGGRLTLTMLRQVGQPVDVHQLDDRAMNQAIDQVSGEIRNPKSEIRKKTEVPNLK